MKVFLKKTILFIVPLLIFLSFLFVLYIKNDPFKVIWEYENYSYPYVVPNRGYISIELLLKNYNKNKYNSFIFGSSRTIAFTPESWRKYLDKKDNVFMLDASGETIDGIYRKFELLNSKNIKIQNAIILICRDISFEKPKKGHLYIQHYALNNNSWVEFHAEMFNAFCNPTFFVSYFNYISNHKYKSWMGGYIENRKIKYNPISNQMTNIDQNELIKTNPSKYYDERNHLFYIRNKNELRDSIKRINSEILFKLKNIKNIFNNNKTNYKIIISPLYEQIAINKHDLFIINKIFGSKHVFNFSGKNYLNESKFNFYENSHYLPKVGDIILDSIYKNEKIRTIR